MHDWLLVHRPDQARDQPFEYGGNAGTGLYYASFIGLDEVVYALLKIGLAVNAKGGDYGTTLNAASLQGQEQI
ncbi:hypothetical protein LTR49_028229, partial [Elasticomyces elasticus]